jgi:predicted dehydrogenase
MIRRGGHEYRRNAAKTPGISFAVGNTLGKTQAERENSTGGDHDAPGSALRGASLGRHHMRVGIVGMGGMGRSHARTVRGLDFVREIMGCDLAREARRAARKEGLPTVEDLPALLSWKPDAAIVAAQATAHVPVIEALLKADVPVLTEKPMASTLEESRRLVALARRRRLPFQVGFELRYCGLTTAMHDVVKSGRIGRPVNISLVQISGPHGRGRMSKRRAGGIFWEKLCHQVDLWRYWLGEPQRIMAVAGPTVLKHYGIHDNVLACLVFPGGRVGTITFLTTRAAQIGGTDDHGDRGHFYEICLTCTRGSVSYDPWTDTLSAVRFNHRRDCQSELVERFAVEPRYPNAVYNIKDQDADFLRRVRDGRKLQFPADDALMTMEWVAKAERSLALGGKWVT